MARLIGPTTNMTLAERTVLEFLYKHKGEEFTAQEIEEQAGIRADLVDPIMDNLRFKGFEVCSEPRRGVHYFAKNSIWSFVIAGAFLAFMIIMLLGAWLDYLDTCPGCPPDDYPKSVESIVIE